MITKRALRAIARNARFVIMDEPTSALTRDEADRLFELVRRLQASGTTIVYVSHFLPEVLALADTVSVLRDGRLVKTSAAEGETPESLVTAMLGRTIGLAFPEKEPPPRMSNETPLTAGGRARLGRRLPRASLCCPRIARVRDC